MARKSKPIKVVLHLPESSIALKMFETKLCDFFTGQVEKRLEPLPKEYKQEALHLLVESYGTT